MAQPGHTWRKNHGGNQYQGKYCRLHGINNFPFMGIGFADVRDINPVWHPDYFTYTRKC